MPHEPHLREVSGSEPGLARDALTLVERQLDEPVAREVPLLVEEAALDGLHAQKARKLGPVDPEHGVRHPLDADVREKLRALLSQLQRVVELKRKLAVHAVALPEEGRDEDAERDGVA